MADMILICAMVFISGTFVGMLTIGLFAGRSYDKGHKDGYNAGYRDSEDNHGYNP